MSTSDAEKKVTTVDNEDVQSGQVQEDNGGLHRRVGNRQIQLFAIGGSIGTGLFVSIGGALFKAGPIGLLLAFVFYSCIIGLVNNSMAEMCTLMPVSGGFVRMAGKWVDDALGFSAGFNFFCYQAISIPFEITAVNVVLGYWRDDIPVAAVCAACIAAYAYVLIPSLKRPAKDTDLQAGSSTLPQSATTERQNFGFLAERSSSLRFYTASPSLPWSEEILNMMLTGSDIGAILAPLPNGSRLVTLVASRDS